MIRVDRFRQENGATIKPNDDWFRDAADQTQIAIQQGSAHVVTDLYSHAQVKMALEQLFYNKCAYCESKPVSNSSWDVEHYRPKGGVKERSDHPGYYWLAYEWENLFLACMFCNQNRRDQPLFDDPRSLPAQGKHDQFPVKDETHRAMSHTEDLSLERPLLLNPCLDEPEDHLSYDVQGQIIPKGTNNALAKETIRICHLTRRRLRNARAELLVDVKRIIRELAAHLGMPVDADTPELRDLIRVILRNYARPDQRYAGFVRAVLGDLDAFFAFN